MSEAVRYRIALPFMAVSSAELRAWMKDARTDSLFVYARGAALDRQHRTVVTVRSLIDEGLLCPHQRPSESGQGWDYLVRRLRSGGMQAAPAAPERDSMEGQCLAILARAANFGHDCPTNAQIARALGLKNADAARYRIAQLIQGGHIRVQDRGPQLTRIVTICSTGRSTSAAPVRIGNGGRR